MAGWINKKAEGCDFYSVGGIFKEGEDPGLKLDIKFGELIATPTEGLYDLYISHGSVKPDCFLISNKSKDEIGSIDWHVYRFSLNSNGTDVEKVIISHLKKFEGKVFRGLLDSTKFWGFLELSKGKPEKLAAMAGFISECFDSFEEATPSEQWKALKKGEPSKPKGEKGYKAGGYTAKPHIEVVKERLNSLAALLNVDLSCYSDDLAKVHGLSIKISTETEAPDKLHDNFWEILKLIMK